MERVFRISGRVAHALAVVSKLLLAAIVLLVAADVVARNFARPLVWSVSLTEYLLVYVTFLPMPALVRNKGHVCADFLRSALPPTARRIVERCVYALCLAICVYLGWVALSGALGSWQSGSYDVRTFDMPKWLIHLPLVIGLWLSAVEFLRYLSGADSIYALSLDGF